jgi:NADH-quinone oxidoreductase subunit A
MPTTLQIPYPDTYFPVIVQVVIAVVVAGALVAISFLLGKRVKNRVKDSPYESGIAPTGSARERFSVKFYLVAIVFILFDIEAVFLYPWAVVYRELKLFGFFEMLLFVALVLAGFFYIWKKGALDWSRDAAEGSPYDAEGAQVTKRNAA